MSRRGCTIGVPFHANGASGLYFGGALVGYSIDGVDIELIPKHNDIMVDVFGGSRGVPGDIQFLCEEAIISTTLISWSWQVLKAAIQASRAGAAAGTMPASGIMLGANGFLKRLSIPSPLDGVPWSFPAATLVSPNRFNPATVANPIALTWRAIPYKKNADSSAGAVLYTN